ncbi:MAG: protein translocase subunit SecD [Dehalococcoidia bacterium]|nr:protein translocase subunit SecD [Dehalococcoidia bacterium]
MLRGFGLRFLIILLLFAAAGAALAIPKWSVLGFTRGTNDILGLRLGLDLRGGAHLVYQAKSDTTTADQMLGVSKIIEQRVNSFGVSEPTIQVLGNNRILVQLPGVSNIEEAKNLIGDTAQLTFKERTCLDAACSKFEDKDVGLTGDNLKQAYPGQQPTTGKPIVNIEFDSAGAEIFGQLTRRLVDTPNRIAVFLDNRELLAPVAQSVITDGRAFIEGPDFTSEKVRTLSIQLESGRLPVPIEVIQEQDVDATLGQDALDRSLVAGLVGLGLVVLFMILYYKLPGLLSGFALMVYVALVLVVFKVVPVTLTLAGIAGFILSIGMAVDANVLIFERMKEELRSGKSLVSAVDAGFARAWPSIRDSNISTMISTAILLWFGTRLGASVVTGFAFTLLIGVLISMFSAIFVSRTFLRLIVSTPLGRHRALFEHGSDSRRATPAGSPVMRSNS